ncbi:acyl CoA binding protein-domain-containing protein [Dichotomocladium elegans]|nr:acyl CoA binding protein-domain-containing protein [Dichotomocladium elegans]
MSIEQNCLFKKAYTYMNTHNVQLANTQKLKLYGLYKQAIEGDCRASRPGLLDVVGRAKWDAWHAVKGMSEPEAKEGYIQYVEELQVGWSRHDNQVEKSDIAPPTKPHGASSGSTMGKSVSKMSYTEDTNNGKEGGLFACVLENDIIKLREYGLTALHHASDRGYVEIVKLLLDSGANVNAKSPDNETALHYACISEQLETAQLLIERGCDVNIRDTSGATAFEQAASAFLNTLGIAS